MYNLTRYRRRIIKKASGVCLFLFLCVGALDAANFGVLTSSYTYPNAAVLGGPDKNSNFEYWNNANSDSYYVNDNDDYMQGGHSYRSKRNVNSTWLGLGLRSDSDGNGVDNGGSDSMNMSAYSGGYIKFWVKTETPIKIGVISKNLSNTEVNKNVALSAYGVATDNVWRQISIPMSAFSGINWQYIFYFFYIVADSNPSANNLSFHIDDLRYSTYDLGAATSLEIVPALNYIQTGSNKEFTAYGFDANDELVSVSPSWSLQTGLGSVSPSPSSYTVVTANSAGQDTLVATAGGATASIPVYMNSLMTDMVYNVYNDNGIPFQTDIYAFPDPAAGGPILDTVTSMPDGDAIPEGSSCLKIGVKTAKYGGAYIEHSGDVDLSSYISGDLKFSLYVQSGVNVRDLVVKLKADSKLNPGSSIESSEKRVSLFGFPKSGSLLVNNDWNEVSIPLSSFEFDWIDITNTKISFLISTWDDPAVDPDDYQNLNYFVDNIRYEVEATQPAATPVIVDGYQLKVGGSPFTVKGVCYSPVPPGNDYSYRWGDNSDIYENDFNLIKLMGANTIRIYGDPYPDVTGGPYPAFDKLQEMDMYVIVGMYVDPATDWDDSGALSSIRDDFISIVAKYKNHPAVLYWIIGNETASGLNSANKTKFYNFINNCAADAHAEEGLSYHPVSTSVKGLDDTGVYTLANLDIWSANIYQVALMGATITGYSSDKCLVITEFGCDAWKSTAPQQEVQSTQASYINTQWSAIAANLSESNASNVCAGACVFEWVDEWWKYSGGDISLQDETASWPNGAYAYDWDGSNNMNEEWWGIAKTSSSPTGYRELREVYSTLSGLWRSGSAYTMSLKNISGNSAASSFSWTTTIGSSWVVSNQYVEIAADPDSLVWGLQIYTDNENNTPPSPAGVQNPAGLVNSDSSATLPLCWKISDSLLSSPLEIPNQIFDGGTNSYYFNNGFLWFKDINTTDDPGTGIDETFINGDYYVTFWSNDGIQYGGNSGEIGAAPSPNYLYLAADFTTATMPNTYSTKIILEFFVP